MEGSNKGFIVPLVIKLGAEPQNTPTARKPDGNLLSKAPCFRVFRVFRGFQVQSQKSLVCCNASRFSGLSVLIASSHRIDLSAVAGSAANRASRHAPASAS